MEKGKRIALVVAFTGLAIVALVVLLIAFVIQWVFGIFMLGMMIAIAGWATYAWLKDNYYD